MSSLIKYRDEVKNRTNQFVPFSQDDLDDKLSKLSSMNSGKEVFIGGRFVDINGINLENINKSAKLFYAFLRPSKNINRIYNVCDVQLFFNNLALVSNAEIILTFDMLGYKLSAGLYPYVGIYTSDMRNLYKLRHSKYYIDFNNY